MLPKNIDFDSEIREIGYVGVDSASLNVKIIIGDLMGEHKIEIDNRMFTPEGDGTYKLLAGKHKEFGRCLIISFDMEQSDLDDWQT